MSHKNDSDIFENGIF